MSNALLKIFLVTLAAAVGVFHGYLKPDLDHGRIAQLEEYVSQMHRWEGRYPEDFTAELLDGTSFQLADEIGARVIVLNFFATWCVPCRTEMPELNRFRDEIGEDRLLLLGIDVEEPREAVEAFLEEIPVTFPVALDEHGVIAPDFEVASYPTTVVIGLDGRIALYQVGAISNAEVTFATVLARQDDIREAGTAISKDEYLERLAEQVPFPTDDDEPRLEGRALAIAEAMPCPCGCEQKVQECGCQTADKISERLAETDLDAEIRTDAEIMEALNREFCVGSSSS